MAQQYLNNFRTVFLDPIPASTGTSTFRVARPPGGPLDSPLALDDYFVMTAYRIVNGREVDHEVMHITAVDRSQPGAYVLTAKRAQELIGSSVVAPANAFGVNDHIEARWTAESARQMVQSSEVGAAGRDLLSASTIEQVAQLLSIDGMSTLGLQVLRAQTVEALRDLLGLGGMAGPAIISQPQGRTVLAGASAAFSVMAIGADLEYQWRRNGVAIAGATSASFEIVAAALSDNGASFDVVVWNDSGVRTSTAAVLTVNAAVVAPAITTQPVNRSVTEGQNATFSVVATGTALTYRWFRNGVFVTGATSATWTFAAQLAHDGAEIYVEVKNSADTVLSDPVELTVAAAVDSRPFFWLGPANAHQVNTQAYIAGGTVAGVTVPPAKRFGSNNSKVGQDTFVTSGGLYGWMCIPLAAAAGGVTFRLVNQGNTVDGWNGAGLPGIQPSPGGANTTSDVVITVAGIQYAAFRLGYPDSLPAPGELVSIS